MCHGSSRAFVLRFAMLAMAFYTIFTATSAAQTYMFGRADFTTGAGPVSLISVDLNGDGIRDLAVANSADSTVSIFLGRKDGTFAPKQDFTTGTATYPNSVVAGDFNGDGKMDLAVANSAVLSISILRGNGDGTFQAPLTFTTRNPPHRLLTADFNGDGILDIATVNTTYVSGPANNSVSILLGNGDGSFTPYIDYPMDGGVFSIASGDFNADGKIDLAVGNPGLGVISVLLGKGDGTFQPPVNYGTGNGNYVSAYLIASDLNGDGKLDLASCGGGNVSVLIGNGDGTFQPRVDYPGVGQDAGGLTADDFNGDGKLDLAVANGYIGGPPVPTVSILMNNGDGTFAAPINYNTGTQPLAVISNDVNSDGKPDLILAADQNVVVVLIGKGDGTFSDSTDYAGGSVPMSITAGDFNGDGKLDLASANRGDNTVSVFLGKGDGTFQPSLQYPAGSVPRGVASADLNRDGKDDLIVTEPTCAFIAGGCSTTGSVSILLANADGTFKSPVSYPVNGSPISVAVGDFNGDGRVDIVVANSNSPGTVSVLIGNGDGTFHSAVDFPTAVNPLSVTVGDFNGDGKLDLAVGCGTFSGSLSILLGNGDGTFQTHVDYPAAGGPVALAAADFNHDSKLDLALVGNGSNGAFDISILLGNGDGTFQTPINYNSAHPEATAIAVGDFNGDGNQDFAVTNSSDNAVTLFLGKGDGTFPITHDYEYSTGGSSFGVASGDFSGNGGSDLAFANFNGGYGNSISVLLNAPVAAIFPGHLSFADLAIGSVSNSQAVTLLNPSGTPLVFASTVATGDFTQSNNCAAKLTVGSNCIYNISFAPTAPLARTGAIVITDNAINSPQAITLFGTGVGPAVGFLPSSVTFAGQLLGTTSLEQTVALTNTGNATLTLTSFAVSGDFVETNQCASTLAVNVSCSIQLSFSPTVTGARSGTLTISDNTFTGQNTLALSGTGADFSIASAPGSSTSATVSAGATATYKLNVTPAGGLTGAVVLTCSGGPSESTCSVSPASVTLDGASPSLVTVTVTTTAASLVPTPGAKPSVRHYTIPLLACFALLVLLRLGVRENRNTSPGPKFIPRLATLSVLIAFLFLAACGGGSGSSPVHNQGTPAGTYSLAVTASYGTGSASVQHTLSLTLAVN